MITHRLRTNRKVQRFRSSVFVFALAFRVLGYRDSTVVTAPLLCSFRCIEAQVAPVSTKAQKISRKIIISKIFSCQENNAEEDID